MSDLGTLVDMGFPEKKAQKALSETGFKGVEPAMEWLLARADMPDEDVEPLKKEPAGDAQSEDSLQASDANADDSEFKVQVTISETSGIEVKSHKCDDCGRNFQTYAEIEFHAMKAGHQSFSQSAEEVKPLTEEEKLEQVKKVENLIKIRRAEKAEEEQRKELEREKNRRKTGQELTLARQRLQEEEIKNLAEMKKREKMEEKIARQRVLEEIERDKKERREKFGMGGAVTAPPPPVVPVESKTTEQAYDECRLQIRLTNGQTLTQKFSPNEELAAVRLFVQMHRTDESGPFSLMTNFPKRVFKEEDMNTPLTCLGLVPSAVLIVSRQK